MAFQNLGDCEPYPANQDYNKKTYCIWKAEEKPGDTWVLKTAYPHGYPCLRGSCDVPFITSHQNCHCWASVVVVTTIGHATSDMKRALGKYIGS